MIILPDRKSVDKTDKQMPQNIEQLIEMYGLENISLYQDQMIGSINSNETKLGQVTNQIKVVTEEVSEAKEIAEDSKIKADSAKEEALQASSNANIAKETADNTSTNLANNYYTRTQTDSQISIETGQIRAEVRKKVNDEDLTGAELILRINDDDTSEANIDADKINLNGVVTANNNFKILQDGSMEAKNGKFSGGTIELASEDEGEASNAVFKVYDNENEENVYTYIYPRIIDIHDPSGYIDISSFENYVSLILRKILTQGAISASIVLNDEDEQVDLKLFFSEDGTTGGIKNNIYANVNELSATLVVSEESSTTTIKGNGIEVFDETPYLKLTGMSSSKISLYNGTYEIGVHLGSGGTNRGLFDFSTNHNFWVLYRDANHTYLQSNGHNIYLRPNNNGTKQVVINSDGVLEVNNNILLNGEYFIKGVSSSKTINLIRASGGACAIGDSSVQTGIWGTSVDIKNALSVGGNITPKSNLSYNLGSSSNAFNRLYVNNIYAKGMGGDIISGSNASNLYVGTGGDLSGKTTNIRGNTVRIYAHTSGAVYLGYSGSTAVTSDENLKNIYDLDDKYLDFFMNLKPISYVYKDNGHRNHLGFGARQVEQALLDADLTTEDFAGVLIDKDVTIGADEAGTEEDVHYDELYSLRYEEFIALNTAMIQKQAKIIEEQQKQINDLEERISKLEKGK